MKRVGVAFGTVAAAGMLAACGAPASTPAGTPLPVATPTPVLPARVGSDSISATLIPAGYGTLKQEDVSIVLQPDGVRISAIPLDESVIRTLAPDSYRTLNTIVASRWPQIVQRSAMHNVRNPRVWYVRFVGLVPDARFVPTDITVTSGGREYRPIDVLPLTAGFADHRLQPREVAQALLLFEDGVDVSQPLTVVIGQERNTEWESILQKLDAERASARARAGGKP